MGVIIKGDDAMQMKLKVARLMRIERDMKYLEMEIRDKSIVTSQAIADRIRDIMV